MLLSIVKVCIACFRAWRSSAVFVWTSLSSSFNSATLPFALPSNRTFPLLSVKMSLVPLYLAFVFSPSVSTSMYYPKISSTFRFCPCDVLIKKNSKESSLSNKVPVFLSFWNTEFRVNLFTKLLKYSVQILKIQVVLQFRVHLLVHVLHLNFLPGNRVGDICLIECSSCCHCFIKDLSIPLRESKS